MRNRQAWLLHRDIYEAGKSFQTRWWRLIVNLLLRIVPLDNTLARLRVRLRRWWSAGVIKPRRRWWLAFSWSLAAAGTTALVHLLAGDVVVHYDLPGRQLLLHGVTRRRSRGVGVVLVAMSDNDTLSLTRNVCRGWRVSDWAMIVVHRIPLVQRNCERMNWSTLGDGARLFRRGVSSRRPG